MLPYLTKCTVVICRQRAIIWKVHIFAFGKQRTMNCSESHPSLKDNIKFCRPFHGKLLEVPCQIVARAREIAESAQCGETGERRKKNRWRGLSSRQVFRFRSAISRALATIYKWTAGSLFSRIQSITSLGLTAEHFMQQLS